MNRGPAIATFANVSGSVNYAVRFLGAFLKLIEILEIAAKSGDRQPLI